MSRTPKNVPLGAKKVFAGEIFDVWQWEQKMFNGSVATFEKIARPDTVQIIALLPDSKIIITHEEQPGKPAFISIPGGRVDEGEDTLAAAKRELLEETGYTANEWKLIRTDNPVSKLDWTIYTYVARGCTKAGEQNLDAGEKISLEAVSFDTFIMLADNEHFHVSSLAPLLDRALYSTDEKTKLQKLLFN